MNNANSSVPKSNCFYYAVLRFASDRKKEGKGVFHRQEAMKEMVKVFRLSSAAIDEPTEKRKAPRYKNRTSRAISNMKLYGELLRWKGAGCYEITPRGEKVLKLMGKDITPSYLRRKYPR